MSDGAKQQHEIVEEPKPDFWAEVLHDGRTRKEWIDELRGNDQWLRRHLFAVWAVFGTPGTFLDVGCGTGYLVYMSRMMGIEAYGVDQLIHPELHEGGHFIRADLREPFSLAGYGGPSTVDMVISWEVAEHLPSEVSRLYCDALANHVPREGKLIFTSAHPGQGGSKHINMMPAQYWRDEFHERGLSYRDDWSKQLALLWMSIGSPLYWLASNIQCFER